MFLRSAMRNIGQGLLWLYCKETLVLLRDKIDSVLGCWPCFPVTSAGGGSCMPRPRDLPCCKSKSIAAHVMRPPTSIS